MRVFISGGCKNGKSTYAEKLVRELGGERLYYIATMIPHDEEDLARIKAHRLQRAGCGFETLEQPVDIADILNSCDPKGAFLLDSVTALLANEMFLPDGLVNECAAEKVASDLTLLLEQIPHIVLVSDYIYSDANLYDPLTENYRRSLAHVDKTLARLCDVVLEISFGRMICYKGNL